MAITRDNRPRTNLLDREFDRLFDQLTRWSGMGRPEPDEEDVMVRPAIDLTEKENEYVLEAEIPGVSEDDIGISFRNNMLILRGQKEKTTESEAEDEYHRERMYGRFERSIRFDSEVDEENIEAEYENGVLTIRLPKTRESMHKEIPVNFKK